MKLTRQEKHNLRMEFIERVRENDPEIAMLLESHMKEPLVYNDVYNRGLFNGILTAALVYTKHEQANDLYISVGETFNLSASYGAYDEATLGS